MSNNVALPPLAMFHGAAPIQRPPSRTQPTLLFDTRQRFAAATPREEKVRSSFFITQRSITTPGTPNSARCLSSGGVLGMGSLPSPPATARSDARRSTSRDSTARGESPRSTYMMTPSLPTVPTIPRTPAPRSSVRRVLGDAVLAEDTQFVADETKIFEHIHLQKNRHHSSAWSRTHHHCEDRSKGHSVHVAQPKVPAPPQRRHIHHHGSWKSNSNSQPIDDDSDSDADLLGLPEEKPLKKDQHKNELVKMLFQHKLTIQTEVAKELLARDTDNLRKDFMMIINRCGMRQMAQEDFHSVLGDVLQMDDLPFSDSRVLFELFDANHSGILDVDELMDGLRLLMIDEDTLVLMYCRKLFTELRSYRDTMLSYSEVEMLFTAVVRYYRNDELVTREVMKVLHDVWHNAHNGSVTVPFLRNYVSNSSVLKGAVSMIPEDCRPFEKVSNSPQPDDVMMMVASQQGGTTVANKEQAKEAFTKLQAKKAEERRKIERERRVSTLSRRSSGESRVEINVDDTISVIETNSLASDGKPREFSSKRRPTKSPLVHESIDIHHPKFRADTCKHDNVQRQMAASELDNPEWYTIRGQVYRKTDLLPAEPVFEEL